MKNANGKGFDKDHRQSSSSQFKSQDKGKKDARDDDQYTVLVGPKCFGCQDFGHMNQECSTYLKSIGKSKALAATLSNTEPKDDSDNKDDGILNAFMPLLIPLMGLLKMWLKKRNWWNPSLRRWMIKMTSIQLMRNYTSFLRSMRNCIG